MNPAVTAFLAAVDSWRSLARKSESALEKFSVDIGMVEQVDKSYVVSESCSAYKR